jgi:hypothetical protein
LAKLISLLGQTFFYWQKLHFFLAKFLSFGKTYIFSWLNITLLAKLNIFLVKLLFIGKTYIFFG